MWEEAWSVERKDSAKIILILIGDKIQAETSLQHAQPLFTAARF